MAQVIRLDRHGGTLGKLVRTQVGGVRVPATLTRTGVFTYRNPDGTVRREYRSPEEVARADSLALLEDAPVTNLHPPDLVNADSFREVSVGHVKGSARMDGDMVVADLVVNDSRTIRQIEAKERREVSCGYSCVLVHKPGVTPNGERYDALQTEIRYNHVALVPRGRAGREVALRLDHDGNQIPTGEKDNTTMKIEIIAGTEYEVGSDAHREAVKRRDAAEAQAVQERAELEAKVTDLETKLDAATKRVDGMDAEIAKGVDAKLALLAVASKHRVEGVRTDMADAEIRTKILGKLYPHVDLTGKDQAYQEALLDIATKDNPGNAGEVRKDALDGRREAEEETKREDSEDDLPADVKARNAMIAKNRGAAYRRDND